MAAGPTDAVLREAARHRGYRLVKSRVKTPGKGDYGRFGLVDAEGAAVFGQDGKTLTATAQEIADFLREGEVSTWAASIDSAEGTPPPKRPRPAKEPEIASVLRPRRPRRYRPPDEDAPAAPRKGSSRSRSVARAADTEEGGAAASPEGRVPHHGPAAPDAVPTEAARRRARRKSAGRPRDGEQPPQAVTGSKVSAKAKSEPAMEQETAPLAPSLRIRKAIRDDAEAIAALVALIPGDGDAPSIAAALPAARGSGVLVADRGGVIGVVAWTVMPTLQRGAVGRITAIVVDEDARRAGVGRALFETAATAMRKGGVRLIEAVSDIEIRNSHRFFRDLGFEQTSYRFAREA
jgi:N-acetylglutamate synthase-like GNAT family acetyltransferase